MMIRMMMIKMIIIVMITMMMMMMMMIRIIIREQTTPASSHTPISNYLTHECEMTFVVTARAVHAGRAGEIYVVYFFDFNILNVHI